MRRATNKRGQAFTSQAYVRGIFTLFFLLVLSFIIATFALILRHDNDISLEEFAHLHKKFTSLELVEKRQELVQEKKYNQQSISSYKETTDVTTKGCLTSMDDVSGSDKRHIVTPPEGPIILSCCQTTKGTLNIAVHPTWAPLGAERFLDMVRSGYFSTKIALFRCLNKFICQFGLAGKPEMNKNYQRSLKDDPSWLPLGPDHRQNGDGTKRFQKGYLAYAGSGTNSRSNQLIVALDDNGRLGGGSPWEVPWGEVIGKDSLEVLNKIYTGYGEKGPSQGRLRREGSSEAIAKEFPLLDYITSCVIIKEYDR